MCDVYDVGVRKIKGVGIHHVISEINVSELSFDNSN